MFMFPEATYISHTSQWFYGTFFDTYLHPKASSTRARIFYKEEQGGRERRRQPLRVLTAVASQQAPCSAARIASTYLSCLSCPLAPCLCPPATNLHDTVTHEVQEEVKQAAAGLIQRDALEKHVDRLASGC